MAVQKKPFEIAEEMLVEAWGYMLRSPDRERGFLSSGSRGSMPQIVRERFEDLDRFFDPPPLPPLPLGHREIALRDRVFIDDDCLMMEVSPELSDLVATVLAMKARPERGGFRWERVWEAMGGKRCGVTSDALARRYERCLARITVVMGQRGLLDGRI